MVVCALVERCWQVGRRREDRVRPAEPDVVGGVHRQGRNILLKLVKLYIRLHEPVELLEVCMVPLRNKALAGDFKTG